VSSPLASTTCTVPAYQLGLISTPSIGPQLLCVAVNPVLSDDFAAARIIARRPALRYRIHRLSKVITQLFPKMLHPPAVTKRLPSVAIDDPSMSLR
jgi:hypothetical protein